MTLRATNLDKLDDAPFDVLIVGGGINGAVSAAALSAGGVRVGLIERGDFAQQTSSHSSNLVWGGIKYLENYEVPLVWNLCGSRNRLMDAYPSNVREVRFFTSVEKDFRWHPAFMFAGTWAYWAMGRGYTKTPRYLSRARIAEDEPAVNAERFVGGVEYSDAYLIDNDARFVFGFIRLALNVGAVVTNYTELVDAQRDGDGWIAHVRDVQTGRDITVRAKVLINAAGPWADGINRELDVTTEHRHVFSRGIHMVVPQITTSGRVLTFFDDSGRMFFVIPMGPRSVIGTTDTRVDKPETSVTEEDRDFLLANVNARLSLDRPLDRSDIIAERCGVRPLVVKGGPQEDVDWVQLSRKHAIEREEGIISLFGGKLTDCLNMGEEVVELVREMGVAVEQTDQWYGEPADEIRRAFFRQARLMRLDKIETIVNHEPLPTRLWRRYGLRAFAMLESIRRDKAMDDVLIEGAEYLRCELYQAAQTEMITTLEDFLRRRSKIALVVPHEEIKHARGIREACAILFGDDAERRYREYFEQDPPVPVPAEAKAPERVAANG
jgi:glycerol-3-phosphate dehydrogenase